MKCKITIKCQYMNKIVNFLGPGKNSEVASFYPTIPAQETKQTNKQSNLLTLTVLCE